MTVQMAVDSFAHPHTLHAGSSCAAHKQPMLCRSRRGIRRQQLEDLIDSGVASTEITGRVGDDCCEDEIYSQVSSQP